MKAIELLRSLSDVFLPRRCPVCDEVLDTGERFMCRRCLAALPRTRFEDIDFNAFEQLFAGKVPIERAVSYFYYERGDCYAGVLHDVKYRSLPQLAQWLAQRAVRDMGHSGFFDTIDAIVPVPLHSSKLAARGYNQSERIARGLTDATGVPCLDALLVAREHATQTHKDALERMRNVEGAYQCRKNYRGKLEGKHVLLVDDVVTTGATLLSCATAIKDIAGIRISLFTLAAARQN